MPGRLKVRILNGRDFPIMDRASELTDAFVEVRFAGDTFKTDVCKKSLNPQWNSEWFKFEAEDEVLQDEPLDLRVLDYDTYSAHDAIGKVYIDLKPLLSREAPHIISGWFPIYDTMHGIRGELNVQVRVELFTDFNKFRQSSCGIQFFCTCEVPTGWHIQEMLGFVEELVVNDDPEYQWIDKIRTPRASNEARQRLFSKLSGELQRKMGVKVLEMGGDAILGYNQNFDLEGESGIVVRAIGTAVSLSRISLERTPPLIPGHISPAAISPAKDSHIHRHHAKHHNHHTHHSHHHNVHQHHHHAYKQHHNQHHQQQTNHYHHHHHHHHKSNNQLHNPYPDHTTTPKTTRPHSSYLHPSHQPHPSQPIQISKKARPKTSVSSSSTQSDEQTAAITTDQQLSYSGTPPVSSPHLQTVGSHSRSDGSPPRYFRFSYSSSLDEDQSAHPSHPLQQQQQQQILQSGLDSPAIVSAPAGIVNSPFTGYTSQQQQQQQQRNSTSPVRVIGGKRLSESDIGSPPKEVSRASSESSVGPVNPSTNPAQPRTGHYKSSVLQQSIDMVEYPFFTMRSFPPGFIVNLGGVVSSRSVKLLDKIHNPEEPETRDAWWSELRTEIKAHASKLGCHAVLGYQEQTTISDDVIILSAMGTAAKVNLDFNSSQRQGPLSLTTAQGIASPTSSTPGVERTSGSSRDPGSAGSGGGGGLDGDKGGGGKERHLFVDIGLANQALARSLGMMDVGNEDGHHPQHHAQCYLCHIPYNVNSLPFDVHLTKCAMCKKKFVPEVLFTTIDPPEEMPVWSRGCLIQARLCRAKTKNKNSEQSAREVSDSLPFLEYEVHNQLINKLKIRGLNCLFGVKIQISIGENMMTAVATATGTYLGPLPSPPMPKISSQGATARENEDMAFLQKKVNQAIQRHRERLMMEVGELQNDPTSITTRYVVDDDTDDDDEETDVLLEKTRDKNTFVLVVDDIKDESIPILLEDWTPPDGFDICNTQRPPCIQADRINHNMHVQMFTEMVRVHFVPAVNSGLEFSKIFDTILRRLCFKLRHLKPCSITDICFNVDLPDEDKVNVAVTGCCLSLHDPPPPPSAISTATTTGSSSNKSIHLTRVEVSKKNNNATSSQTDDMMFSLDGVSDPAATGPNTTSTTTNNSNTITTTTTTATPSSTSTTSTASTVSPPSTAPTNTATNSTAQSGLIRSGSNARHSVKPPMDLVKKKGTEVSRGIELTPLNVIHNRHITGYLGYYNFFFIRESTAVREIGGIGGFIQSFLVEVLAIVRSHVMALGGNGMVAFNMGHFILDNNPHKNQGQCLINVSGDIVMASDYVEDQTSDQVLESTCIPVPASSST